MKFHTAENLRVSKTTVSKDTIKSELMTIKKSLQDANIVKHESQYMRRMNTLLNIKIGSFY